MLHFVIDQMSLIYPDQLPFYELWDVVWNAGKVSDHDTVKSIEQLESMLKLCENEYIIAKELHQKIFEDIKLQNDVPADVYDEKYFESNPNLKSVAILIDRLGIP